MKKKLGFMILLVVMMISLVACKDTSVATNSSSAPVQSDAVKSSEAPVSANASTGISGTKDTKFVMVTFLSGIEYWKNVYKGFQDAAVKFGVTVEYTGAAEYDVNQEVTILEQVIAKKPAGIAITAMNPDALVAPINKAIEAGIPVVLFDAGAPKSKAYSFLATSNYNAGVSAARNLAQLVGGKGNVAVVTIPGQQNHEDRTAGFKDTIAKEFKNIKVVSVQDSKGDSVQAAQATAGIIQSNPDLVGVFATDANGGVGVGTAVKEAKKVGAVKIISFDTDKGTLDLIKDGTISSTLAQGTWSMGYWSLNFLHQLHNDLLKPVTDWKGANISPLPSYVDTGVAIVNKDNVKFYEAK